MGGKGGWGGEGVWDGEVCGVGRCEGGEDVSCPPGERMVFTMSCSTRRASDVIL